MEFLKKLLAEFRTTLDFYIANRKALGMAFADRFALLPKSVSAGRDIRLSEEDHDDDATRTETGWDVRLPDCCVVCGEPTDREWLNEVKPVLDLSWPMFAPVVGLCGGIVLNWYFDNRWCLPIALIAGFIAGHRGSRKLEVRLRLKRCAEHSQRTTVPSLRAVASDLVVRVGNRRVKQKFKNPEVSGWEVATPKESSSVDETPSPFPFADNIPEPGQMMQLDDGPITGQVHSFQQMPGETGLIFSPSEDPARDTLPGSDSHPPSAEPQPKPTNGQAHDPLI